MQPRSFASGAVCMCASHCRTPEQLTRVKPFHIFLFLVVFFLLIVDALRLSCWRWSCMHFLVLASLGRPAKGDCWGGGWVVGWLVMYMVKYGSPIHSSQTRVVREVDWQVPFLNLF